MRAIITGVGHYVPEAVLTNQDLESLVETSDEWITTRTGIRERRILDKDKGTSYMAVRAAQNVLEQRKLSPDEIDLIIAATVTPDMLMPNMAAVIQRQLRATRCWGFDVNAGCSGFACALVTAAQFIESNRHQKVLVIGADKMSAIIDYQDRNTCILFGDGAGAVLLEPSANNGRGMIDFSMHTDGSGDKFLCMPGGGSLNPASHETVDKRLHFLCQEGKAVFKHAITGLSEASARLLGKHRLDGNDLGLFIPHQANARIIHAVSEKLGVDANQVVMNIDRYGNTTAGSIPIALDEALEMKIIGEGSTVVFLALGAGVTWGAMVYRFE